VLAVRLITFTVFGAAESADHFVTAPDLEVGLCCEVETCVSSSILKSVQNISQESRALATAVNLTVSG
jgi:hypothetical protein